MIVHDAYEPKAFDYAKACKHAYNYKQFKFTSGANAPQFLAVAVPGGCWLSFPMNGEIKRQRPTHASIVLSGGFSISSPEGPAQIATILVYLVPICLQQ